MVSPMTSDNGPAEQFSVLGATANGKSLATGSSSSSLVVTLHACWSALTQKLVFAVYEVTVRKHPDCTCPDFQKGNLCKHYLFVMLRVLRLDRTDPLVWQKALLKSEVMVAL